MGTMKLSATSRFLDSLHILLDCMYYVWGFTTHRSLLFFSSLHLWLQYSPVPVKATVAALTFFLCLFS